ncbi:MAG: Xaa-Pro peptidase family protein [Deltaproteobacteria bacterium]|jgi:Xaa-Pro aminopeptidase|nr:Xaa-Pro peptidase family protein [Deltaproteobacteria bacterium]
MTIDSGEVVEKRVENLRKLIKKHKLTGLLITSPENRRYFSGFEAIDPSLNESSGCLLITLKKLHLLTDSRYTESALAEAPLYTVGEGGRRWAKTVASLIGKTGLLGVEDHYLTLAGFNELKNAFGQTEIKPAPFNPSSLRVSKTPSELALIVKALRITEKAISLLWDQFKPGTTEKWAAFFLDRHFKELGGEGPAFETIVAAGKRASLPHAVPGSKKLTSQEMVVIDCGARYRGYASDITRTLVGEKPLEWQKLIYRTVREAQLKALEVIGPGVPACEVDLAARNHIAQAGFGDYFGHSLGHGVGLAVHEEPSLNSVSKVPLPVGAVVTIEPGIYIPGKGGVRLEQLVEITENGRKILNSDLHFYEF